MRLILPAAGRGTRMASATGGGAKELLPLGSKTVIDWVAEEAPGAQVCLVGSLAKPEMMAWGESKGALYREQPSPKGLGPALAIFFDGEEPCLASLPDTVFHPSSPSLRLWEALNEGADVAVAVEEAPVEKLSSYGICRVEGSRLLEIVEKPKQEEAPSRWAVAARYGFSARVQTWMKAWLEENLPDQGEISISPAITAALQAGFTGAALPLLPSEARLDCGSPEGYEEAMRRVR